MLLDAGGGPFLPRRRQVEVLAVLLEDVMKPLWAGPRVTEHPPRLQIDVCPSSPASACRTLTRCVQRRI